MGVPSTRRRDRGAASGDGPRLWPLAVLAGAVPLLALAGILPRWPGLVHFVALPPADLFTDLRVLLARTWSVLEFVTVLVLVLVVRVVVLSLLLGGLTWRRVRFAALFYGITGPVLLLAAQLGFLAQAVLYSRVFWAALALFALVWFLSAPIPWRDGARRRPAPAWWRVTRVEVLVPYAVALTLLGALADVRPGLTMALVPVSALATGITVVFLARPPGGRPLRRLAAAGTALAVLTTTFVVTRGGTGYGQRATQRPGSVLLMSGVDSSSGHGAIFETETDRLGFDCDQTFYFSYAGTGDGQPRGTATCPIRTGAPYRSEDTQRPLEEQIEAFAGQLRGLPRPLVVAAHSHAVWVAWQAVARGMAPEVDILLLVGPFPDSPVGYPPPGRDGEGRVAGELLRLVTPLAGLVDFHFDPDAPAARELLASPDAARTLLATPMPAGVRTLSVTSATDLPLMPSGWRLPVDRNACPQRVPHPYLPVRPSFYNEVNRFLDGRPALDCPVWRDWGAPLSRPFGVPPHGA